jgi:protein involved in polysaccharide export with SLBB domain
VTLLGEVVSPGTYTLTRRSERISDVLARAGGLRSSAYPAGVRLRRAGIGAINIDLPKVLTNASYRDNLVMEAGDTVEVPAYVPVIRVRGAVQQPTAVAYVPGKRIDYYIDASGGATALGDAGKAFTQQANGTIQTTRHRFLFRDSRPMPLPGATVIVPEKPERTPTNWGGVLSGITGVLGSIITIIAISR